MAHRSVWWLGVATLVAAVVLPVTPPTGSVTAEEQTQCDQPGYPQLERCYAILTSAADSRGSGFWIKIRDGLTYDPDSMFVQSVQWITMPGGWWIEAGYRGCR